MYSDDVSWTKVFIQSTLVRIQPLVFRFETNCRASNIKRCSTKASLVEKLCFSVCYLFFVLIGVLRMYMDVVHGTK